MKSYAILGNCQANALAATLQVCEEFKSSFSYRRVTPIHRISAEEHQDFLRNVLPTVELFMYQPISDRYRGGGFGFSEALDKAPSSTAVVSYPSIQFYGYHASSRTFANMPYSVRERCRDLFGLPGSDLFHYSQIVVAFLRGLSTREARDAFHEGFDGDAAFIAKRTRESLTQLRQSEQKFNIDARLHDIIIDGYRRQQLFWSPRHPSGVLLAYIANLALGKLGIIPTNDEVERMIRRDPLYLPQYPMQDTIRKTLHLEFDPLVEFRSKTKTLSVPDMISSYYDVYAMMPKAMLVDYAKKSFANLGLFEQEVA